jgi:hypothetical protein
MQTVWGKRFDPVMVTARRLDYFVPILYQDPAFEALDDFSDFVESISCETSKTCQVSWFESTR